MPSSPLWPGACRGAEGITSPKACFSDCETEAGHELHPGQKYTRLQKHQLSDPIHGVCARTNVGPYGPFVFALPGCLDPGPVRQCVSAPTPTRKRAVLNVGRCNAAAIFTWCPTPELPRPRATQQEPRRQSSWPKKAPLRHSRDVSCRFFPPWSRTAAAAQQATQNLAARAYANPGPDRTA